MPFCDNRTAHTSYFYLIKRGYFFNMTVFFLSDDSDEEFTKGAHSFIDKVKTRRRARNIKRLRKHVVGAENRIVAAMTFEKAYL